MRPLLALTLLASLALGCGRDESEPVAVARAYADAARRSDVPAMLAVIEHDAVAELERAAERASDQVGGRRAIEATEMLQIAGVDRTLAVAEATLVEQDDQSATVELVMTDGRTVIVHLVWEANESEAGGAWKVRVPLPSATPSGTPVPSEPDA
ncbi:hypothetical protein ACNOYE_09170 [Nannocystaceae bacterium ST9]